jgi:hypothetical protein
MSGRRRPMKNPSLVNARHWERGDPVSLMTCILLFSGCANIGQSLPQPLFPAGLGNTELTRVLIKLARILHFRGIQARGI